jgi:hypothetical protein
MKLKAICALYYPAICRRKGNANPGRAEAEACTPPALRPSSPSQDVLEGPTDPQQLAEVLWEVDKAGNKLELEAAGLQRLVGELHQVTAPHQSVPAR